MRKQFQHFCLFIAFLVLAVLISGCDVQAGLVSSTGTTPSPAYRLNVSRTFGYSSGSQIKGSFRLQVTGVTDIQSVEYFLDGTSMAVVSAEPFQLDFQTQKYPTGIHALSAVVTTSTGSTIEVPSRSFEFATAAQESESMVSVLLPLGGIVIVAVGLGLGLQFLAMRKRPHNFIPLGTARNYGIRGGAICPKCGRPTAIHPFSFNVGIRTVFDFCENCGKWSALKRLSEKDLRDAEEKERKEQSARTSVPKTEDEKLHDLLDNSKYSQ